MQRKKNYQQSKRISKNYRNFNFDDFYTLGKDKVGQYISKDGIKELISSGKKTIKSGVSGAKNLVSKYLKKKNDEEYKIDANADFNSYDLGPKENFENKGVKSYNPTL